MDIKLQKSASELFGQYWYGRWEGTYKLNGETIPISIFLRKYNGHYNTTIFIKEPRQEEIKEAQFDMISESRLRIHTGFRLFYTDGITNTGKILFGELDRNHQVLWNTLLESVA